MWDLNTIAAKVDREVLPRPRRRAPAPEDPKQRKLMVGSLCLLLLALGIVLWHDRDFWFPDTPEAESDQPVETSPAKVSSAQPSALTAKPRTSARAKRQVASEIKTPAPSTPPPPVAVTARTALPALEVEVVAGDTHRTIRPGSSSVHVD